MGATTRVIAVTKGPPPIRGMMQLMMTTNDGTGL